MRRIAIVLGLFFLVASCGKSPVAKPDNLIEKDKMVDIFYDLSLMEAIRSQKPAVLLDHNINPDKYIYDKYKIDSLQFANSNRYYASDLAEYKKMYEAVAKKLEAHKTKGATLNPDAPQVQ